MRDNKSWGFEPGPSSNTNGPYTVSEDCYKVEISDLERRLIVLSMDQ